MRCLLRKAYVAAAVQDGKFVQEFRTGTSADLHRIALEVTAGFKRWNWVSIRKELAGKQGSWILQRRFHGVSGITLGATCVRLVQGRSACDRRNRCAAPTIITASAAIASASANKPDAQGKVLPLVIDNLPRLFVHWSASALDATLEPSLFSLRSRYQHFVSRAWHEPCLV